MLRRCILSLQWFLKCLLSYADYYNSIGNKKIMIACVNAIYELHDGNIDRPLRLLTYLSERTIVDELQKNTLDQDFDE